MPEPVKPWYRRLFAAQTPDPKALISSPDYYPAELMPANVPPAVSFIETARDIYRQSSFLDHRMRQKPGAKKALCNLRDLFDLYREAPPPHASFIFHVAFCCSTLLARYLELLPGTFVLKEPFLITQLAEMNRAGTLSQEVTRLSLQLLSRTYIPFETPILKLTDQCNGIASRLMAASASVNCIFIGLELRSFLIAGLKDDQRRKWVRRRAELAELDVAPSWLAETDTKTLTDAEACAYLWLSNGVLLQKLLRDVGDTERVLVIDGERISDQPGETLQKVAACLGLSPGEPEIAAAVGGPAAGTYSKDPSKTFTREDRRAEISTLNARLGSEVEAALTWAGSRARDLGLDCRSGTMLAGQRP